MPLPALIEFSHIEAELAVFVYANGESYRLDKASLLKAIQELKEATHPHPRDSLAAYQTALAALELAGQ